MNYKNSIIKMSSVALLFTIILPSAMFADTNASVNASVSATSSGTTTKEKGGFCANLDAFIANTDKKLGDKDSNFESRKADQEKKISERQADRDGKLEKNRGIWSSKRDNQFSRLEKKAKTDAQKQAVETFKTTVTGAIKAREAAIDQAVATYRTGLATIASTRKSAVEAALQTLKTDTDAVLAKAKADCASGVNSKTVKASVLAGLKDARAKFSASVKNTAQNKADLQTLLSARKAAFVKAQADFKTAYDKALSDLKAAFA